jgi:CelD/BcsL family acetyltransferase involved in cellulose biosynthesis
LPFTDHCPPLASSPSSLALFSRNLARWRAAQGVARIAVHGFMTDGPGVHVVTRAVRHVLPLGRSSDRVFESFKGSSVRRAIRKAQREGVETRISRSPEDLAPFYRLHLRTRRRLGVPVQPRRFIEALWNDLLGAGLGFAVIASHRGEPIAAALFLAWNRNLIYKFGASDPRYWALRPNNLVIWTAIEWACWQQYRLLDFGRTDFDNQGLRDFKNRWGALEVPLVYSYVGAAPSGSLPGAPMRALATVIRSAPPIVCQLMGEVCYQHLIPNVS